MEQYNSNTSRREFLSGIANLTKAAAFGGLAAVVAACSSDNVENFNGKAGSKNYDYYARSSIYSIELTNPDESIYAKFEGKRPDMLETINCDYDGTDEPTKTFRTSHNEFISYTHNQTKREYTEFESLTYNIQDLFNQMLAYHLLVQHLIKKKRGTSS